MVAVATFLVWLDRWYMLVTLITFYYSLFHFSWYRLTQKEPTLFLGIDVTHPSPGSGPAMFSIGAIVGNIDHECHQFDVSYKVCMQSIYCFANYRYNLFSVQKRFNEQMVHFDYQLRDRLIAFCQYTNHKPERIIVFRDGISDSQFLMVSDLFSLVNYIRFIRFRHSKKRLHASQRLVIISMPTTIRKSLILLCKNVTILDSFVQNKQILLDQEKIFHQVISELVGPDYPH